MTDEQAPPRSRRWTAVAAFAALALVAAGTGAWALAGGGHDGAAMAKAPMLAPAGRLDLATVVPATAAEYRYAAAHTAEYAQLRCWCGCQTAFGHRNLADCFVRPDGGWEAHGAGCGVCMGEAVTAHRRLDAGDAPGDIARALDAEFGPTTFAPTGA